MFSLGLLRKPRNIAELDIAVGRAAPFFFLTFLAMAAFNKYFLILKSDGGGDLLGSDIPKSLMLLKGQNPYSTQPWASPYPPFLLMLVGGIIRLTGGSGPSSPALLETVSRNVMLAGLAADLITSLLIFLALRVRGVSGFKLVVPTGLFLVLPAISSTPYFWFHSDVFGYPILAASLLALLNGRYFAGSTLLALATIFKVHPILSIPLVLVWLARRQGWSRTIPSIASVSMILGLGLLLPLSIPGYGDAVFGFNLSTGFGNGTSSFTLMNLFYGILPERLGLAIPVFVVNQIWVIITTTSFVLVLGLVWGRARTLDPVDMVLLGLLVWLIPLRQMYTHYVVWAMIPFLMRGRLQQTILVGGLLEVANTMAVWSWNIPPNPLPVMNNVYGFFLTSLAYAGLGLAALWFVIKRGPMTAAAYQDRPSTERVLTSFSENA